YCPARRSKERQLILVVLAPSFLHSRDRPTCITDFSIIDMLLVEKVPVTLPGTLRIQHKGTRSYRIQACWDRRLGILEVRHRNDQRAKILQVCKIPKRAHTVYLC